MNPPRAALELRCWIFPIARIGHEPATQRQRATHTQSSSSRRVRPQRDAQVPFSLRVPSELLNSSR